MIAGRTKMSLANAQDQTVRQVVDHLAAIWLPSVVPLFVSDPKSKHRILPAGTGFVLSSWNGPWLVTAQHVLENVRTASAIIGNFAGKSGLLSGCVARINKSVDIAAIRLDAAWANRNGISTVKGLPISDRSETWGPTGLCILFGYPQSRNRLNSNTGKVDRRMMAYQLGQRMPPPAACESGACRIAFSLDHKAVRDLTGRRVDLGALDGTSGGPIVEVFGQNRDLSLPTFSVSVVAVMSEWHKGRREIIGEDIRSLKALLHST